MLIGCIGDDFLDAIRIVEGCDIFPSDKVKGSLNDQVSAWFATDTNSKAVISFLSIGKSNGHLHGTQRFGSAGDTQVPLVVFLELQIECLTALPCLAGSFHTGWNSSNGLHPCQRFF